VQSPLVPEYVVLFTEESATWESDAGDAKAPHPTQSSPSLLCQITSQVLEWPPAATICSAVGDPIGRVLVCRNQAFADPGLVAEQIDEHI